MHLASLQSELPGAETRPPSIRTLSSFWQWEQDTCATYLTRDAEETSSDETVGRIRKSKPTLNTSDEPYFTSIVTECYLRSYLFRNFGTTGHLLGKSPPGGLWILWFMFQILERMWVDHRVLNSAGIVPYCNPNTTSVASHRNKESWGKLRLGHRPPQGTCHHQLPYGCNASTKKQTFFGSVSHCPKSSFSFECLWNQMIYLCIFLKIAQEWSARQAFSFLRSQAFGILWS